MLKRVFSSFLDPVAGHSQSVSLISSSSFSTPHFPISSSPRGKPHIIGPHTSLSLHQYPSAFSRSTRLPSHLPSLSPTKFPPAKCQDLNQASRGKHLDHTSSHAKLLLLFLSSSLLCYSFKLKAPYCCAPPDPSSLKHSETRQRKQEPRLKQLLSFTGWLPPRCGMAGTANTQVQSSLTLCKYPLLPRHGKHSLLSAWENSKHNSFQLSIIH